MDASTELENVIRQLRVEFCNLKRTENLIISLNEQLETQLIMKAQIGSQIDNLKHHLRQLLTP